MKIDIKTLNYACHQHNVQCEHKGELQEVNHREFTLKGRVIVKPGTGAEYLSEENLEAIGTMLPKGKKASVLSTYLKVLRIKLTYCRTEITEVEFL